MSEKIIEDVHAEWHPEQGTVKLIAENLDGSEFLLGEFAPLLPPSFADESIPVEDSDYEEYYNEALNAAHRAGYVLAGESDVVQKLTEELVKIYNRLDEIQEMDVIQANPEAMWEVGEAMGALDNAIDELTGDDDEEGGHDIYGVC